MDQKERPKLVEKIEQAFANTPPPSNGDVGYELDYLAGTHWRDVSAEMIARHKSEVSWFSSEGFRFYLPAMSIAVIFHPEVADTLCDNIVVYLGPAAPDDDRPSGGWAILEESSPVLERAIGYWADIDCLFEVTTHHPHHTQTANSGGGGEA